MPQPLKAPDWLHNYTKSGRYICPVCSPHRQSEHRHDKTMRVTIDDKGVVAHCHHCQMDAVMSHRYDRGDRASPRPAPRDENVVDLHEPRTPAKNLADFKPLTETGLAYLASRGIGAEVASLYGVVSGRRYFPPRGGEEGGTMEGVGFRYEEGEKHVATKWRSPEGKCFVADGAPRTLWGPRVLPGEDLILTEGEIDAMSVFQAAGIKAKSLPNGATDNASPNTRFTFLDASYEEIKAAGRVILFLDNDAPGRATQKEIARRIGRARCWRVNLPEGVKDANDALRSLGQDGLAALVKAAEPWPVEGLVRPSEFRQQVRDLRRNGMPRGVSTGIPALDPYLSIMPGMLYVVTGRPGAGKSTFIDQMEVAIADRLGWHWTNASFESPGHYHIARLISQKTRQRFAELDEAVIERTQDWIDDHFAMLTSDGMVSIDSVLERAEASVMRYGSKGLVIDPYNFIRDQGREADTEFANEVVAKCKMFAQSRDVAVFIVAHPSKPQNNVGQDWAPGGYNISGSANFFNRADFGITVARTAGAEEMEGSAAISVWKCRWGHLGKEGTEIIDFDPLTERFYKRGARPAYEDGDPWA